MVTTAEFASKGRVASSGEKHFIWSRKAELMAFVTSRSGRWWFSPSTWSSERRLSEPDVGVIPAIRLTSPHHMEGLVFFRCLTLEAKNLSRRAFRSRLTVFRRWRKLAKSPDIKACWRLAIRVLNSGVIHGGSLRWTLDFTAGMIASRPAVMMSHSCLERSSILGAESKMDQSTAKKNRRSSAFLLARVSRLEINFLLGPPRDGLFLVRTMTTLWSERPNGGRVSNYLLLVEILPVSISAN